MDYTHLGKRIREERIRLNLTQEKLAEAVNISTAYLGQIERGERQVTRLHNIKNASDSPRHLPFHHINYNNSSTTSTPQRMQS